MAESRVGEDREALTRVGSGSGIGRHCGDCLGSRCVCVVDMLRDCLV